ncbi:MAG TPA: hypothetical protein VIJ12_08540 [Candidatus Baltobacteraceae bacterium]
MNGLRLSFALALAVALTTAVAGAQSYGAQSYGVIPSGTQVTAVMDTTLDSGTANPGDPISMHVVAPYPNNDDRFAGATLSGHVIAVTRASRGTVPKLQLGIDTMTLQNGTTIDINAQVTGQQTNTQQKSGAKVAIATLGGMLLGNLVGKTIFHTGGGGLLGAAGGFLYGLNDKTNITLPAGNQVTLTTTRDVVVRPQSRPPK